MNNKFVVIDLETTGNSPKKGDKIIQFAAVVIENGTIIESFNSLINPQKNIPIFIEELTGINDEMVKNAPCFEELAPKIQNLLEDAYFVAHNVLFDLSFLQEELIMANQEGFYGQVIDTVELARFLLPTMDSYKLNDLAHSLGFKHERPHQADSDAEVTAKILLYFMERLNHIPLSTCQQLSELSGGLKSDIQLLLEDLIEIKKMKVVNWPENLEAVNGIVIRKQLDETSNKNMDIENYSYPFAENEKEIQMKKVIQPYQKRVGQLHMMDKVFESLISNQHLLVEAGTGIGKTLGYLIPAAYFSKSSRNKVIISTFTTQLQSQLILKDIPLLKQMIPFDIHIALLKGKSHYLSLSKFEESLHDTEENYDTCLTKMQILIWLLETETGDVDELNLSSGGQIFWNRIKHGQKTIMENEAWREKDFYTRAKNKVYNADIIITNHDILLSDVTNPILPSIPYVILDEAHHFHKVAFKYFGAQLDYFKIRLLLNQIGLLEQKQMLFNLDLQLRKFKKTEGLDRINELMSNCFFELDEFFKAIKIYVKNNCKEESSFKVSKKINQNDKQYDYIFLNAERFSFLLKEMIDLFQFFCSQLNRNNDENSLRLSDDLDQICLDLTAVRDHIRRAFLNPSSEDVVWIDIDFRSYQNSTTIYLQPISISEQIQQTFFNHKRSVVLTSASLSIDNNFNYLLDEIGLNKSTQTLSIPSPFDYPSQLKVFIPEEIPEINTVNIEDYIAAITEQIISIAEVMGGRILILFTSHDMLRKTYVLMKESGLLEDYALFAQGITGGSRIRLTRNFQKFEKALLMGTSSFWEGIDIPGEDLSCLIMVRLPFTPPDDPFMQAKYEEIKRLGGNPFMDVSLPEAVLRFKQGFGRLIRSDHDKGVFIIFDRRIVKAKYGKAFLSVLPNVTIKVKKIDNILQEIRNWIP